ncbi:hypothetical protein KCV07_g3510, partial [Aureobasidium melanogenum]
MKMKTSLRALAKKDKKKKKTRKREQEFWPLIKVVRLYVKADGLSTGAVLVDLPGVADSNAARAAVAEGYMKQCTGLWIVSPINRAVDDKAAKNLLGSAFRRQLKFDGTYSAITFICSKTDEREDEDKSSDNSDNESQASDRGSPLTAEDIETKIQELKTQKKEARRRRSEIEAEVTDLNNKIKELKVEARNIEDNRSRICIDARNQYSKSAIQVDFAAGIKEASCLETAADEDLDTFNPKEDLRDYEKVAKDLPVYCVSSRAYQKLSGRLVKDNAVRGFTDVEQTEIPALKLHCKRLTEKVRSIKSRRFLTLLSQLCTSLALWSSNDGSGVKKTDQQRDAEQIFLARKLKDLEKDLEKDVQDTLTETKETLNENIFENYGTAINAAANAALLTSQGWGVFTGSGGLSNFNAQLTELIYKHLANGWEKAF